MKKYDIVYGREKYYDGGGYYSVQHTNAIVMSVEEAEQLFNDGGIYWMAVFENKKTRIPDFKTYLQSKGIKIE